MKYLIEKHHNRGDKILIFSFYLNPIKIFIK